MIRYNGSWGILEIVTYKVMMMLMILGTFAERDGDELEGTLIRKHEWESTTKKASNRYNILE